MIIVAIVINARVMSPITTRTPMISVERGPPGPLGVTLCVGVGVVVAVFEGVGGAGKVGVVVTVSEGVGVAGNVFCMGVAVDGMFVPVTEGVVVAENALCVGIASVGVAMVVTASVEVAGNTSSTLNWTLADCSVPSILQVYVPESDS